MLHTFQTRLLPILRLSFLAFLLPLPLHAQDALTEQLKAEMYRYFATDDSTAFITVTDKLKERSLELGDEQLFYRAWGNQAIYESAHSRRTKALEVAREMRGFANDKGSHFGVYTATHVMASIYYKMENYDEAEKYFLKSIELLHRYFPGQSAAPDYLELTKIVRLRNDFDQAYDYASRALEEPDVIPQHKVVALSMLCQIDGLRQDRDTFNRHYAERKKVRQNGGAADNLEKEIEITYRLLNGMYDAALRQADSMDIESRDLWRARVLHRMGNDSEAYDALILHINVRDSLRNAEKGSLLSDYMMQLENERLESERLTLEQEKTRLQARYWYTLAAIIVVVLAWVIYRRYKTIRRLEHHNRQLDEARLAEQHAREEAEKALDVKREFLNNISHELRTPLNPITGFSDILATPGFELGDDERQAMSQHIKESSRVLTGIIDNMIELSFYESKTSLTRADRIAPKIICQHIVDEMKSHCQEGVTMVFDSHLTENHTITTDVQSTERVLRELLGNAASHTQRGSIKLVCEETGGRVRFIVSDTGTGIAADLRPHLFEPFNNTGDNVKTTGMGLSICHRIARLLGGTLTLDESYTDGARFIFEIPSE